MSGVPGDPAPEPDGEPVTTDTPWGVMSQITLGTPQLTGGRRRKCESCRQRRRCHHTRLALPIDGQDHAWLCSICQDGERWAAGFMFLSYLMDAYTTPDCVPGPAANLEVTTGPEQDRAGW